MAGELQGRTALVTGASRGIGLAIARELIDAGAWVAMVARTSEPLARAAESVAGHAIPADVSTTEGVHTLATYLGEVLGDAPDLIVSAAGAFSLARLDQASPEDFDRQIAANLRAPFLLVRAFLPAMLRRRGGHVEGDVAGELVTGHGTRP